MMRSKATIVITEIIMIYLDELSESSVAETRNDTQMHCIRMHIYYVYICICNNSVAYSYMCV